MKKIRVLIVEDSSVVRLLLELIVGADPRLEVAGAVETAEEALRILDHAAPDVITMDIRLPGMNGFEATQRIMQARPTPIVVVAASTGSEDLQIGMNALRAGALTVLEKPVGATSGDYASIAERLCTQIFIMSGVKVVRRWAENYSAVAPVRRSVVQRVRGFRVLGIASSTGGPAALVRLLGGLGAAFPLPILIVQHIAGSFLEAFAAWLAAVTPFGVEIVRDRSVLSPGKIYVAVQDHHLYAEGGAVRVSRGEPVSAQRPSGTVLFQSMAAAYGSRALAVILTGMGDDGAEGLLSVRESGGYTMAEDNTTAVVYGMPAEAVRIGAVMETLPLPAIAPRILEITAVCSEAA